MRFFFLFVIAAAYFSTYSQSKFPYQCGEKLKFEIFFGPIGVGYAELIVQELVKKNNKNTFHIVGKGRTAPFFDWFFKVRDVYETFIDTVERVPVKFIRNVNEGGYVINQNYDFYHDQELVKTRDSMYVIPKNSQDMLSAFFFMRTLNNKKIKKAESFFIPIFLDEENYKLKINYLDNEIVETKWGNINCMVFQPQMQEGRVFKDGSKIKVWISDDNNRLLVKVETEVWAGKIRAILIDGSDFKESLSIIKE